MTEPVKIWLVGMDGMDMTAFTFRAGADAFRQLKKHPYRWFVVELNLHSSLTPEMAEEEKRKIEY